MLIKLPEIPFANSLTPLSNWKEPVCTDCNTELTPWHDWGYYSELGFCNYCEVISVITPQWQPSQVAHPKAEIDELIKHKVTILNINKVYCKKLINYHINQSDLYNLNTTRLRLTLNYTTESIFLQHLIWFLLFRDSHFFSNELIKEFIWFRFKNPDDIGIQKHKLRLYEDYNLSVEMNKYYTEIVIETIYDIWKQNTLDNFLKKVKNIKIFMNYSFHSSKKFEREFLEIIKKYGSNLK